MLSFLQLGSHRGELPTWWTGDPPAGHTVELEIYGDRMLGRLRDTEGDRLRITIPVADQVPGLLLSTVHGTAWIARPAGVARVPVSCWGAGEVVRLQVIGPAQFIQRRSHPRLVTRLPVTVGWLQSGQRSWAHARSHTVDLSLGGLRMEPATTVWPAAGLAVQVRLELTDGPCQLQAEVVGTTPDYGLRLAFTDLAAATAERIKRLTR